nr:transposase zinc-binding domain-containing protein [Paenibacillus periandrae]
MVDIKAADRRFLCRIYMFLGFGVSEAYPLFKFLVKCRNGLEHIKTNLFDRHQHWDAFVQKHSEHIRPNVLKEVQKFRGCGDPRNGFKILVCEGCHDIKRVPYRCKGRFCTTCSCGETEEWSRVLMEDVFQVNHRHVVFTIDEGLWSVFLFCDGMNLLSCSRLLVIEVKTWM